MGLDLVKFIKGFVVRNESDMTKEMQLGASASATTGTKTILQSAQTANRTVTLPDATDTIVARNTTETLTNKTLTAPVINSPTGITKADVGLGNVDNTSDSTKNAAVATLTNKTLANPILAGDLVPNVDASSFVGLSGLQMLGIYTTNIASDTGLDVATSTGDIVLSPATRVLVDTNRPLALKGTAGGVSSLRTHPLQISTVNYILPNGDGTSGQTLSTDGSGNMSWTSVVGPSNSQTLTNKTIVVANNTITTAASGNLAATELNAALAELQSDIDTRANTSLSNLVTTALINSNTLEFTSTSVGTRIIRTSASASATTKSIRLTTGDQTSGVFSSGSTALITGNSTSGSSGSISLQTGTGGVDSGSVAILTGVPSTGNSGDITFTTPPAPSIRGSVILDTKELYLNFGMPIKFANAAGTQTTGFKAPAGTSASVVYNLPTADGTSGQTLTTDGSATLSWATPAGAGDVIGPTSATDGGFVKFDGTTGKLIKNYSATIFNTDVSILAGISRSKLAVGSVNHVVINDGSGVMITEANLAISRGGTNGSASPTAGAVAYGTGGAYAFSSVGTSGQYLISNGASSPSFTTLAVNTADIIDGAITPAKRSTAVTGLSSASGNLTYTNQVSYVDITNMSVTITTTGRPCVMVLVPDGSGTSLLQMSGASAVVNFRWLVNGGNVGEVQMTAVDSGVNMLPGGLIMTSTPAAGSNTFKLQIGNGSQTTFFFRLKLFVYEL